MADSFQIAKIEEAITPATCLKPQVKSFHQLIQSGEMSQWQISSLIANYLFIFCNTFYNITENINESQAVTIAIELTKHRDLTLDDIVCFIKSVKENEGQRYGKVYNRIDPATILEWFDRYQDLRIEAREKLEIEKRSDYL